jgi:hypothetical protein
MILLEDLFSAPKFAGVDTASPLQLAICRASEGLPIGNELTDDEVEAHFGCARSRIGLSAPLVVVIIAGVRSGKSFLVSCGAIRDAFRADLSSFKPWERGRHAIVAPTVDNAMATFHILRGIVEASPVLRPMIVGEPTQDSLVLRRPDGKQVEIVVVAAHRGAVTLRSRWLTGATLEEVAFFGIESTGAAVNAEEMFRTATSRPLPGTQVRLVTSPLGRSGLAFDLYQHHFGKPGDVLVVHAPTLAMNPKFPASIIEALRARDPDAAAREHDAAWIDADTALLPSAMVDACTRSSPLVRPADPSCSNVCAGDLGFRGNATTVIVGHAVRSGPERSRIVLDAGWEWKGSKQAPLSPDVVFADIASKVKPYGIREIHCDGHSFDACRVIAAGVGLRLVQKHVADRDAGYALLSTAVANGPSAIELPSNVNADLKSIRRVVTPNGMRIQLPITPDGRHADFAPSVALAVLAANGRAHSPSSKMVDALRRRVALGITPAPTEEEIVTFKRLLSRG